MTGSVQHQYELVSGQHAHDVALLHDQEILAVDRDLGARPFAEQHAVADLEVDRDQLAGFVPPARADRGDFALRGLFLAVSGMMMPPLVFSSASIRLTMTRSCSGRNLDLAMRVPSGGSVCRSGLTVDRNTRRIRHRKGQNRSHFLAITLSEC